MRTVILVIIVGCLTTLSCKKQEIRSKEVVSKVKHIELYEVEGDIETRIYPK